MLDRPDVKVLLSEQYDGKELVLGGQTVLERGASIVWFVFPGCWYDVGRLHLVDGTFTGWYTNLCTPLKVDGDDWSLTDLFLDFWVPAAGAGVWLDRDEFDAARADAILEPAASEQTLAEHDCIAALAGHGEWPPPICREIDLAWVMRQRTA